MAIINLRTYRPPDPMPHAMFFPWITLVETMAKECQQVTEKIRTSGGTEDDKERLVALWLLVWLLPKFAFEMGEKWHHNHKYIISERLIESKVMDNYKNFLKRAIDNANDQNRQTQHSTATAAATTAAPTAVKQNKGPTK
jgi:hypothetical protein